MKRLAVLTAILFLTGCTTLSLIKQKGEFFCNEEYLSKYDNTPKKSEDFKYNKDIKNKDKDFFHYKFADDGYIYTLVAALALQSENDSKKEPHFFPTPEYLKPVLKEDGKLSYKGKGGFEARTYIYTSETGEKEIIIAFAGSQGGMQIFPDWLLTNLFRVDTQYNEARKYVLRMRKELDEQGNFYPIAVTGFSLGGALASHVALHPDTNNLVTKVWIFNPSPIIYPTKNYSEKIPKEKDPRFHLAATRKEFVQYTSFAKSYYKELIPEEQMSNKFHQVVGNKYYSHFRWVLGRTIILYAAHYEKVNNGVEDSRPRQIINDSKFASCDINREKIWYKKIPIILKY